MLQSCGRSSLRHAESLNEGFSAPEASPLKKNQPASNERVVREVARTLVLENESAMVAIKQSVISFSILVCGMDEFRGMVNEEFEYSTVPESEIVVGAEGESPQVPTQKRVFSIPIQLAL